jgi:DNA-binding MarR family transcriptional regulator
MDLDNNPSVEEQSEAFEAHVPGIEYGVLDSLVGYALRRAQQKLFEDFALKLAPWNITPQRFSALVVIAENPDIKPSQLARVLNVSRSGTVSIVDALVDLTFVVRKGSPEGKHKYTLRPTSAGKRALREMTIVVKEHDRHIVNMLTDGQRRALMGMLRRMVGP